MFFAIMVLTQLYVKVGIISVCGKFLHDRLNSCRGKGYIHKTSLPRHILLNFMYLARRVSVIRFLAIFWRCSIFVLFVYVFYLQCAIYAIYLCRSFIMIFNPSKLTRHDSFICFAKLYGILIVHKWLFCPKH